MNWASSGPPSQLEVTKHNQITLCTKAADIAEYMNEYFISKVQNILSNLNEVSMNLNGCRKIMDGRQISLSLSFVKVETVRKLLRGLKPKTSSDSS